MLFDYSENTSSIHLNALIDEDKPSANKRNSNTREHSQSRKVEEFPSEG